MAKYEYGSYAKRYAIALMMLDTVPVGLRIALA
jgi:hypothetical protein